MKYRDHSYIQRLARILLLAGYLLLLGAQTCSRFYAAANLVQPAQLAVIIASHTGEQGIAAERVKDGGSALHLRMDKRYQQQAAACITAAVAVPLPKCFNLPAPLPGMPLRCVFRFNDKPPGLRGPPLG